MKPRIAILAAAAAILSGCAGHVGGALPGPAPTPADHPVLPAMVANLIYPKDLGGLLGVPDHACDPGAWPPCDR